MAISCYEKVLQHNPNNENTWLKKYSDAIAWYDKAEQLGFSVSTSLNRYVTQMFAIFIGDYFILAQTFHFE